MSFLTADLFEAHDALLQSCETPFFSYGGRKKFFGPIRTIQTFEDNALIKQTLATPGHGAVLVVDAGGSRRTALVGDMLGGSAVANGWAGVILFGVVRDTVALGQLDLGVKALGTNPRKSAKAGIGQLDIPVTFGTATFTPGAWVYSDEDGVVVSPHRLT